MGQVYNYNYKKLPAGWLDEVNRYIFTEAETVIKAVFYEGFICFSFTLLREIIEDRNNSISATAIVATEKAKLINKK